MLKFIFFKLQRCKYESYWKQWQQITFLCGQDWYFFFLPLAQCPSKITSWRTQMLQWVTQCFQNLITWVSPCSKLPLIAVLPCIMDKDNYWTIVTEQCVMLTSKYIFSHHMPFPLRHIPSSYSVLLPTPCHTTNCKDTALPQ